MARQAKSSARKRRNDLPELILRHIRESIIATNLEGLITYWNQGAAIIFGYSAQEIIGTPISRLYTTPELQHLRPQLDRIRAGKDFTGEWEALRKDSKRIWLQTHRTLLKDAKNRPIGFLGVSRDITQQKKEAEAIRQSEQLYRAIGESIDFGVWSCDHKGRLTHMSDSFMKFLGLTSAQNLSDGWLNALHPDERESIMEAWRKCFSSGKPWSRRYRISGANGTYRLVHTYGAPVRDDNGQILCWAGLNLDAGQL
jgi:PAS domain S-box-containing protein